MLRFETTFLNALIRIKAKLDNKDREKKDTSITAEKEQNKQRGRGKRS